MSFRAGEGALPEWLRFTPEELANQVAASVKQTGKRKLTKELTSMAGLEASKVAAGPAGKMVADAAAAVSVSTLRHIHAGPGGAERDSQVPPKYYQKRMPKYHRIS